MRNKFIKIFILLLLGVSGTTHAQTIVGGGGVCYTNANPNTVPSLTNGFINKYNCTEAYDTVNNVLYGLNRLGVVGTDKWVVIPRQTAINGTLNYLPKYASTGITPSQVIDNGTNLGINVASPVAKTDIYSTSTTQSVLQAINSSGAKLTVGDFGGANTSIFGGQIWIKATDGSPKFVFDNTLNTSYNDLSMLSKKITNLANGTNSTDAINLGQLTWANVASRPTALSQFTNDINNIRSFDTRNTNFTPVGRDNGLYADFRDNTVGSLSDGGTYHGVLTFRKYGIGTDMSGGNANQLAITDNGNLWIRTSNNNTTWGTYQKFWLLNTDGSASLANTLSINAGTASNHAVRKDQLDAVSAGYSIPLNRVAYGTGTGLTSTTTFMFNGTTLTTPNLTASASVNAVNLFGSSLVRSGTAGGSLGFVELNTGTSTNSGYLSFYRPNQQRSGYIGYSTNTGANLFSADNGSWFEFTGSTGVYFNAQLKAVSNATLTTDAIPLGQADGRYGQLAVNNTWSGIQTVNNFVNINSNNGLQFNSRNSWLTQSTVQLGNNLIGWNVTGNKLLLDEEFSVGVNGLGIYNNAGGTALTLVRTNTAISNIPIPNSTGFYLKVQVDNSSLGTSPNWGGIVPNTGSVIANRMYVQRFRALLPVGYQFERASNSIGTNGVDYFLSSQAGTGKWEEYIRVVKAGDSGTFSTTFHIAVSGSPTPTVAVPLIWYVASHTVIDVTNQNQTSSLIGQFPVLKGNDGNVGTNGQIAINTGGAWNWTNSPYALATSITGTNHFIPKSNGAGGYIDSKLFQNNGALILDGVSPYFNIRNNGANAITFGTDDALTAGSALDAHLYVYGANKLFLSTNGVKAFTIFGNQNIGIGSTTDNSLGKLQITGNLGLTGDVVFNNDQTTRFIRGNANGGAIRIRSNSSAAVDRDLQFGNIDNGGNFSQAMSVTNNLNVTIGTATDNLTNKLQVAGSIYSTTGFFTSAQTVGVTGNGTDLLLKSAGTTFLNTGATAYVSINGNFTGRDYMASRLDGTGVYYFGGLTNRYLYYDGTQYQFINASLSMNTQKITGLADGTNAGDAINLGQSDARYARLTGANFTGQVSSSSSIVSTSIVRGGALQVSGLATVYRDLQWLTSGSLRWDMGVIGAESGSNNGSNMFLARYSDAGAYLGNIFDINRASGLLVFGQEVRGVAGSAPTSLVVKSQLDAVAGNISGATNYISKFTNSNTIGNSLIYDNGTNVLIGATSSTFKFGVTSNIANVAEFQYSDGTNNPRLQIIGSASGIMLSETYSTVANSLMFGIAGVEAMRINNLSNLIIGGTTSTAKVTVNVPNTVGEKLLSFRTNNVNDYGDISVQSAELRYSSPYAIGIAPNNTLSTVFNTNGSIKSLGGAYQTQFTTEKNIYKDVFFESYNSGVPYVGAYVIEMPFISDVMMQTTVKGYDYSGRGQWSVTFSGYTYSPLATASWYNYRANIEGEAPFKSVKLGYNTSNNKYVVILGDITDSWAYPKIAVTEVITGFTGNHNTYATGWTGSFVTSLTGYGDIRVVNTQKAFSSYGVGTFAGTPTKMLGVDGSGRIVETNPITSNISGATNYIPVFTGANSIGSSGIYQSNPNLWGFGTINPTGVYGATAHITSSTGGSLMLSGTTVVGYLTLSDALGRGLLGTTSNHPFAFMTNNVERARFDASGNFMMNLTSSPYSNFHLHNGDVTISRLVGGAGTFGKINFYNTGGYSTTERAYISSRRDANADNGFLEFATAPTTNVAPVVRMTIDKNGDVDITGSVNSTGTNGYRINGNSIVKVSGNYTNLNRPDGVIAMYLGNTGDPNNYYDNTVHHFRNSGGTTTYLHISSNGIDMFSRKIGNLASGTVSGDAINLGQLNGAVSGATNQIAYFTGTNTVSGSSMYWHNSNGLSFDGTRAAPRYIYARGNGDDASLKIKSGSSVGYFSEISIDGWDGTGVQSNINFKTGGVDQMRLVHAGNLMLGTTTDLGAKLGIVRNSTWNSESSAGIYIQSGQGATNTGLLLGTDKVNNVGYIQIVEPSTAYGTKRLALNPNGGNVGVGLPAPLTAFHMQGLEARFGGVASGFISLYNASTRSGYIQANAGVDLRLASDTDPMTFWVGGSEKMQLTGTVSRTIGLSKQNFYTNNSNTYRDVMYYDNNASTVTGAFVIETPIVTTGVDNMLSLKILGYNYSGHGAWEVRIGGYTYNTTIPTWLNHSAEIIGNAPFTTVRLARNPATNKYIIILGGVTDNSWSYPKIHVSELIAGYSTTNNLGTGWSASFVTDVSSYTGMVTVDTKKYFRGYGVGNYASTPAYALGVNSSGSVIEYSPITTSNISGVANYIPVFTGTNSQTSSSIYQLGTSIGINTTTPIGKLTSTTADNDWAFYSVAASGAIRMSGWINGFSSPTIQSVTANGSAYNPLFIDAATLNFGISGVTRMTLNSSGNLLIGNTSGGAKLTVVSTTGEVFRADAASGAYRVVANQTGVLLNGIVGIGTSTGKDNLSVVGTIAKYTTTGYDNVVDNLIKYGVKTDLEGTGQNLSRWIGIDATLTAGGGASNKMFFKVYNGTTTGSPVDVMTLLGNGNVGIGTTTAGQKFEVAGVGTTGIRINNTSTNTWDILNSNPSGTLDFIRGGVNHLSIGAGGVATFSQHLNARDITASRGDGTGVYYFAGLSNRYLYYDGTTYRFVGATVDVNAQKITGVANGTGGTDAVNYSQLIAATSGAVSGTINVIPKFTAANVIGNSQLSDNGAQVIINGATPLANSRLSIKGAHGDTRIDLYSVGDGSTDDAFLSMWASEPSSSYGGTGIGSNIQHYTGTAAFTRKNTIRAAGYMRFAPTGNIEFVTVGTTGTVYNQLTLINGGLSATFGGTVTVANASANGHAINLGQGDLRYASLNTANVLTGSNQFTQNVILKDAVNLKSSNSFVRYFSFQDAAASEAGWMGYGSASNNDFFIVNTVGINRFFSNSVETFRSGNNSNVSLVPFSMNSLKITDLLAGTASTDAINKSQLAYEQKTSELLANIDNVNYPSVQMINKSGYSSMLRTSVVGGSTAVVQEDIEYNGTNRYRTKTDGTTWTPWYYHIATTTSQSPISGTILHSGNYNTYAPTLTGTGASGTWSINTTGSAGSVAWANVTSKPNVLIAAAGDGTNNTNTYINARVLQNSNTTTNNDGMYLGYGNTNAGITRIFGGGATTGGIQVNGSGVNDVSIAGYTAFHQGNYNMINMSSMVTGTLPDARLSTNVALDNINNNFSAVQTISLVNDENFVLNKISGSEWNYMAFKYGSTRRGYIGTDNNADMLMVVEGTNKSIKLLPTGTGTVNVSGFKVANLLAGTLSTDAVNKAQLDAVQSNVSAQSGNWGQLDVHGAFTDFNAVTRIGASYLGGSTNAPSWLGVGQGYQQIASLGSSYTWAGSTASDYAQQTVIGRNTGTPYFGVRWKEAGVWTAWNKIWAGKADVFTTPRLINGTTFDGSADILNTEWLSSLRDFTNGTLITTNINYAANDGDAFLLEIKGNSYGNLIPLDIKVQGYIYSGTIISIGGISNGYNITGMVALNSGGNLCFWFPNQGYWQGYSVNVTAVTGGGRNTNRATSITNVVKPAGATKEVALSSQIIQSLHANNYSTTLNPVYARLNVSQTFTQIQQMGSVNIGNAAGLDNFLQLGLRGLNGTAGNNYSYIDFIGDDTYTDYGLRIIRGNGGANATSIIGHRGTGKFQLSTSEDAVISFATGSIERMVIGTGTTPTFTMKGLIDVTDAGQGVGLTNKIRLYNTGATLEDITSNSYGFGMNHATGRVSYSAGSNGFHSFFTQNVERFKVNYDGTTEVMGTALKLTNGTPIITMIGGSYNAPTFTTQSAGTKMVWYPAISTTSVDYATGIESNTLWNSVPTTSSLFKWYGGTTLAATISGTGNLTLVGNINAVVGNYTGAVNAAAINSSGQIQTLGLLSSSMNTAEGGSLELLNMSKTGAIARNWRIYNMGGGYGNSLVFWSYNQAGGVDGRTLNINDDGTIDAVRGTISANDATAARHLVNRQTGDARYGQLAVANTWSNINTFSSNVNFNSTITFNNSNSTNTASIRNAGATGAGNAVLQFNVNSTEYARIAPSGRFLINTVNDDGVTQLQVIGSAKVSGLTTTNTLTVSSVASETSFLPNTEILLNTSGGVVKKGLTSDLYLNKSIAQGSIANSLANGTTFTAAMEGLISVSHSFTITLNNGSTNSSNVTATGVEGGQTYSLRINIAASVTHQFVFDTMFKNADGSNVGTLTLTSTSKKMYIFRSEGSNFFLQD